MWKRRRKAREQLVALGCYQSAEVRGLVLLSFPSILSLEVAYITSLHGMLSLKLKTACRLLPEAFLKRFRDFRSSRTGFHFTRIFSFTTSANGKLAHKPTFLCLSQIKKNSFHENIAFVILNQLSNFPLKYRW